MVQHRPLIPAEASDLCEFKTSLFHIVHLKKQANKTKPKICSSSNSKEYRGSLGWGWMEFSELRRHLGRNKQEGCQNTMQHEVDSTEQTDSLSPGLTCEGEEKPRMGGSGEWG